MQYKEFVPPVGECTVIDVYDGDTITIGTHMYNENYKFKVRIRGVDCPEIRYKKETDRFRNELRTKNKQAAIIVRNKLRDLILNKEVKLTDVAYDKYGRLLANVKYGPTSVADWLISNRYAVPYNGKTKSVPSDWLAFINNRRTIAQRILFWRK